MAPKFCFMNSERPCDLTCKAAFEVDDPVDNVDCYFIWLAHHFGEGVFEARRLIEGMSGFPPGEGGSGFSGPGSGPGAGGPGSGPPGSGPTGSGPPGSSSPKGPKGFPNN